MKVVKELGYCGKAACHIGSAAALVCARRPEKDHDVRTNEADSEAMKWQ
jgi:hypothetical protein